MAARPLTTSVSVNMTSDMLYDYTCSPCTEDGLNSEATYYCSQCAKLFCDSCIILHNKILRSHSVLDRTDLSKWCIPKVLSGFEICERHEGKELEMFCCDHDKVCCSVCISVEHRQKYIQDFFFNFNFSTFLNSLMVECWYQVWEVPGSIPSQGLCHTNDVITMIPVVPLFSTQH